MSENLLSHFTSNSQLLLLEKRLEVKQKFPVVACALRFSLVTDSQSTRKVIDSVKTIPDRPSNVSDRIFLGRLSESVDRTRTDTRDMLSDRTVAGIKEKITVRPDHHRQNKCKAIPDRAWTVG